MQHHKAAGFEKLLGQKDILFQPAVGMVPIDKGEIDFSGEREQLLPHARGVGIVNDLQSDLGVDAFFYAFPMRKKRMLANIENDGFPGFPIVADKPRLAAGCDADLKA